jgi:threonine dehydratase
MYKRIPKHMLLPDGTPNYLRMILTARVYDIITPTPLTFATQLSGRLGVKIHFKREDLQPVFSFKCRGAYNCIAQLSQQEKENGVVACSAGNHAQGVALACNKLGIKSTIVMPMNTPSIKFKNVKRLGSNVLLHGSDFDMAKAECSRLEREKGWTAIPPFDDPYVIAGQGTVASEILRQIDNMDDLDAVFVCVGGGGLLAGIATYIKQVAPPHVKVVGIETVDADALTQSFAKGERVMLEEVGLFSDGTAVRIIGEECWRVLTTGIVDEMVLVDNDEICAAIKDIFEGEQNWLFARFDLLLIL